jgi:hypothetical protein
MGHGEKDLERDETVAAEQARYKTTPRTIAAIVIAVLVLGAGGYAANGGNGLGKGNGNHGKPSVIPPPPAYNHCTKLGYKGTDPKCQ